MAARFCLVLRVCNYYYFAHRHLWCSHASLQYGHRSLLCNVLCLCSQITLHIDLCRQTSCHLQFLLLLGTASCRSSGSGGRCYPRQHVDQRFGHIHDTLDAGKLLLNLLVNLQRRNVCKLKERTYIAVFTYV